MRPETAANDGVGSEKLPGLRWWICGLLFVATIISYIDRQTISIAAPVIVREFHLSNEQFARILSAFLVAYTFGQLVAGRFFDWIGSRVGFSISITVWSLANTLSALVTQAWGFVFFRFMLGVGESGNFPGGVKVVTEWFSPRERAFAGGLFTSGASVGAVLAGPLVGTITHYWGWRAAFAVTGSLGFVWLIGWLVLYHPPSRHPRLSEHERSILAAHADEDNAATTMRWVDLFRFRQVWALVLARILEEPLIWMAVFWLPKYIVDVRGLSILQTGWFLTLPFIALDIGYISGGWVSGKLAARGWSLRNAKLAVMTIAALFMAGAIPAATSSSVAGFAAFLCLATLGHGSWFSNILTMPSDIAPRKLVASVYGISAMGGGLGGLWFTEFTGFVTDRFHTYTPVFLAAGLLPLVATATLVLVGGRMSELSEGFVRGERASASVVTPFSGKD
ncbi:MAG: MFS transporter [Acidobacteria bacterium]|nr:MFS transporter [Acidobacteriota bacterium]MCI0622626.1 MFS transporter [Acidobacteriota bacterium]